MCIGPTLGAHTCTVGLHWVCMYKHGVPSDRAVAASVNGYKTDVAAAATCSAERTPVCG